MTAHTSKVPLLHWKRLALTIRREPYKIPVNICNFSSETLGGNETLYDEMPVIVEIKFCETLCKRTGHVENNGVTGRKTLKWTSRVMLGSRLKWLRKEQVVVNTRERERERER